MVTDEQKATLRQQLTAYVGSITKLDRRAGARMYICPLCGSGTGKGKGTKNGAFSIKPDGLSWHCFSCEQGGDIFTLIGLYEGLADFKDQLQRAADLYGIDTTPQPKARKTAKPKQDHDQEPAAEPARVRDYSDYIERCRRDVGFTDYFRRQRGFTDEEIDRFHLGYDMERKEIVIPYNANGSYYATRRTDEKRFSKPKSEGEEAAEPVYNAGALYTGKPCFVCEGQLDAISIMAVGGATCTAVALGGTGHTKLIRQINKRKPTSVLILALDNDEPGQKATEKLAAELAEIEDVTFITASWKSSGKDPNDFLKASREILAADIAENIAEVEKLKTAELNARLEDHNATSGTTWLQNFVGGIKEKANTRFIPTGYANIDEEIDGGLYPGLYILGAISSMGKTTFLLQLADQIAEAGEDVLYFSLEMKATELVSKSVSRHTYLLCGGKTRNAKTTRGITTASRYDHYNMDELQLIDDAIAKYGEYGDHIHIYEALGDIGVEDIKRYALEHIELTGKVPVIFIDYLQILKPINEKATDKQNTDKAVLALKRLSGDLKTPVVAISSFNRDNYVTAVTMAAFKESGAIEYGSDVLLALQPQGMLRGWNKTEQKKNAELVDRCKRSEKREIEAVILKNRNGKTGGKVGFNYYSLFNCFEVDSKYKPLKAKDDFVVLDEEDDDIDLPWK